MSETPVASRASLSVVILHERRGSYLQECLRRLKVETDDGQLRIIECANSAGGVLSLAEYKNRAVTETRGEFVLLVSAMDIVEPGCVERLSSFMQSHSDVAAAGALLLGENGWPRRCYMRFPGLLRFAGALGRWFVALNPRAQRYGTLKIEQELERRVDALPASCVMIRRTAFDEIGPFERGYEFRFDDIDWGWRARRKGWRLCVVPRAKAYHVAPLLHGSVPVRVRLAYEQSLRRFLLAHRRRAYRAVFWGSRMIGVVVAGTCAGLIALLTAFRSRSSIEHFRANAVVLRWRLSGSPEAGSLGDAEQTTRWEYAGWRAD